jgi:glycerol-3-phosphate dehydrogenase
MPMLTDCNRPLQLRRLEEGDQPWDIAVVGGGASGVGVAVDAAARGYRVVLFEQSDFGKGTSSRSTKLIHGGLRYLQQGRSRLVREALRERGLLCQNAPHLVHPLLTLVPLYAAWEGPYYGFGVKLYDWLSGNQSLGPSRRLSAAETLREIPTLEPEGLRGSVSYFDAAFDDARLLVNLVQTCVELGGVCLNYAPVRELTKESGRVTGLVAEDTETGRTLSIAARVVVNAAGPFSDQVQRLDDAAAESRIVASQGAHLVLGHEFLPGSAALLVPRTRDGRVVFAIPWHGRVLVGTTDTPLSDSPLEPQPQQSEIDFLLDQVAPYLARKPSRTDIRTIFAGVRPLVRVGGSRKTAQLGRDHVLHASPTGLVSIMGGKWTIYRKMAEDCVDLAARVGNLPPQRCRTQSLSIHGGKRPRADGLLAEYGVDQEALAQLITTEPAGNQPLDQRLPYVAGQVIWAARYEMARTVEDLLARRVRALFLDTEAALSIAPRVAELLAGELGHDAAWQTDQIEKFRVVAQSYRPPLAP